MCVASLCEVANAMEAEARKLEKEGGSKAKRKRNARSGSSGSSNSRRCDKSIGEPTATASSRVDAGAGASAERATRILRVLIIAFNAFLQNSRVRGQMYSTT